MKKIFTLFFLVASISAFSQCEDDRYKAQIFDNVSVTSDVQYGSNYTMLGNLQDLYLDIYQPEGDTENSRPLIVMAHGGFFVAGSKEGDDVVPFCEDFAKMGYVVASIQYRLGMEADPLFPSEQTSTEAVVRGFHDYKAAIRFLRKTVEEDGNPYGIDPDMVFSAGVSAGGFLSVHSLYMNELDEIPAVVDTNKLGLGGGLEGLTGNSEYSSELVAGINIAGAIGDTSMIDAGEKPLISFHGDMDGTVPFNIGTISLLGIDLAVAMGSNTIHTKLNEVGIANCLEVQEDEDHVPHVGNPLIYDSLVVRSRNFLAHFVCGIDLSCEYEDIAVGFVSDIGIDAKIYPNPSSDEIRIEVPRSDWNIEIYSVSGQLVYSDNGLDNQIYMVKKERTGNGTFLLKMRSQLGVIHHKLIFN
ncbi:MAG: carboxylesterase family protein [Flavobacteriales bacterium]|nr:carboxylesterase family protein [Flavobacteriales bacterium]